MARSATNGSSIPAAIATEIGCPRRRCLRRTTGPDVSGTERRPPDLQAVRCCMIRTRPHGKLGPSISTRVATRPCYCRCGMLRSSVRTADPLALDDWSRGSPTGQHAGKRIEPTASNQAIGTTGPDSWLLRVIGRASSRWSNGNPGLLTRRCQQARGSVPQIRTGNAPHARSPCAIGNISPLEPAPHTADPPPR